MKRLIKFIALISVVCIVSTLLSGCSFIKELKENKVVINENGDLVYKNNVYKKLSDTEDLYIDYDFSEDTMSYALKEDEPILYGFIKSEICEISKDKLLIEDIEGNIYCREDKYESTQENIEGGFTPEKYIYTYEVDNEQENWFEEYTWETKVRYITDDEMAVINEIFTKTTPNLNASELSYESDYMVDISACSEDLMLRKFAFYIFVIDDKYYLEKEDNYYNSIVYEIPEQYNKTFKKIMAEYVKYSEEIF